MGAQQEPLGHLGAPWERQTGYETTLTGVLPEALKPGEWEVGCLSWK